jgi:hypothetical protein
MMPQALSPLIIESIVTTVSGDGAINVAPMGVEWGEESIVLKPFLATTTYRNLIDIRTAVVNLTDDVRLFARAAISNPQPPTTAAVVVRGVILDDCCSWRELELETLDSNPPRARATARVVHRGFRREFIGFNRARHAVLETAIYATRLHLLPRDEISREVQRLQIIVDKTAGPAEYEAMTLLTEYIERQYLEGETRSDAPDSSSGRDSSPGKTL